MKLEVSNGEVFDKYSILRLKLDKVVDPNKKINIREEIEIVKKAFDSILNNMVDTDAYDASLVAFEKLCNVNEALWKIEDDIRDKERNKEFDAEFIELARSVYVTNDQRCKIKKDINIFTDSNLIEEKSYADYL